MALGGAFYFMGIFKDFYSRFAPVNKSKMGGEQENEEGAVSDILPELALTMDDDEIIELTRKWEQEWNSSDIKNEWIPKGKENRKYWLGQHFTGAEMQGRPIVDNLIWEGSERFLQQTIRRTPEPHIEIEDHTVEIAKAKEAVEQLQLQQTQDPGLIEQFQQAQMQAQQLEKASKDAQEYADDREKRLFKVADRIKLRLKLKDFTRKWFIYLLGVVKIGWDIDNDDPTVKVIRPHKLILDPHATIEAGEYNGRYIGEYREIESSLLIKILPKKKKLIEDSVQGKTGTTIQFIEWNTPEYVCWTYGNEVLFKAKNPHFNYDKVEEQEPLTDEYGIEVPQEPKNVPGVNHFRVPKIPYQFLSILNLGGGPVDDTSYIGQNLANQDLLNKHNRQITQNAELADGLLVISLAKAGLTKEQATEVVKQKRKGGAIIIPDGVPKEAVDIIYGQNLPSEIFTRVMDMRARMRDMFSISGLTPSSVSQEKTVRGKIINKGLDTESIGAGITEFIEQASDGIYNWLLQMLYVYHPEETPQDPPRLTVSVKEGSMLPKDNVSEANQAIELAIAGKMSLLDMYKKLEAPNPEEMAANMWLELNSPQTLYANDPRIAQVMQQQAEAAQQQQQMQQDQQGQQMKGEQEGREFEQKGKMELELAKQEGNLLKQVPIQK